MSLHSRLIVIFLLVLILIPGSAAHSQAGENLAWTKVVVDNNDPGAALSEIGARRLIDYGAFSLWALPSAQAQALSATAGFTPLDQNIYLRGVTLSPAQPGLAQSSGLAPVIASESSAPARGLWIVQFIGPVLPEWPQALRDAGLQVIAYLPNHAYLVWGEQAAAAVAQAAGRTQAVQWSAPYLPEYRLAPALRARSGTAAQDVTIQVLSTPYQDETLAKITAQALQVYQPPASLLNTTLIRVQISANRLLELASMPDVINIEPFNAPEMLDEIQGQSMAGQLSAANGKLTASQPGYLQWLASKGFPGQADAYPLVGMFDDGLDAGSAVNIQHPDFRVLGSPAAPSRVAYIVNCTNASSGGSVAGHGNLNGGILAGYNDRQGWPYEDSRGFQLSLGISPYGRIGATKIFDDAGRFNMTHCPGWIAGMLDQSYRGGARITSNSWGAVSAVEYNTDTLAYDAYTRDAHEDAGDQPMLHVFSAGNNGIGSSPVTIGSPGTAKNVLTVGASEGVRAPNTPDGCLISDSDSVNDVADFSSIGPTVGGRAKPDILAPGTHIQGPATQIPDFTGPRICGGIDSAYYPPGQTLYTWSSGTSHATPAVSGAAQLIANYYSRVFSPGSQPSPAMLKALILNTPRYMSGEHAGDTLPSPTQGWGSIDLGKIFDDTPRKLIDQTLVFDSSGAAYETELFRPYFTRPIQVTLVWTDAPGSPGADRALVNDLDLEVTFNGQVFRGNVFSGPNSITGGAADHLNNVESIFLPPGQHGKFSVRVVARNLAGDGLPNRPGITDQDFALVIYNGSQEPLMTYHYWFPASGALPLP